MAESRVRVKICGIKSIHDARLAVESGVDAIGLVFFEPSPRHVDISTAHGIVASLPPFVTSVALFVDPEETYVQEVMHEVGVGMLQFHGSESEQFCSQFDFPYMKAIRVRDDVNLLQCAHLYPSASALLADAYAEGMVGGSGQTFDWTLIPDGLPCPLILSGGLDAGNVTQAIQQVRPYAVDVSSGVERAKGIKDLVKIKAFMQGVANATL
ncbi:MAG: phosphoribosylanthranilate isomerase [Proteobacteria bacterium]|nr:phosphoribosylanthranilate isomerase [Pseudomonadota bacterium]MDE3207306.1 phosphoribosylanthranilate isomerase [Pseudomonadota bacterium]